MRVSRRELVEIQVDGTAGSAVAGLRHCAVPHQAAAPGRRAEAGADPDLPDPAGYRTQRTDTPASTTAATMRARSGGLLG